MNNTSIILRGKHEETVLNLEKYLKENNIDIPIKVDKSNQNNKTGFMQFSIINELLLTFDNLGIGLDEIIDVSLLVIPKIFSFFKKDKEKPVIKIVFENKIVNITYNSSNEEIKECLKILKERDENE